MAMSAVFQAYLVNQMQTTATNPTPTSSTPTLTLTGYAQQAGRVHKDVKIFVEKFLAHAELFGNFSLNVTGFAPASALPTNGVRLQGHNPSSVQIVVQANGPDYRYSGYLQATDGTRPHVLWEKLMAASERRFFDPKNPPQKKSPSSPETNGEGHENNDTPVFTPLAPFDQTDITFALSAINEYSGADGCEIKTAPSVLIRELGLGNVNPDEVETLVMSWVTQGLLERVADKVKATAKGRLFFEPDAAAIKPPSPAPPKAKPQAKSPTVSPPPVGKLPSVVTPELNGRTRPLGTPAPRIGGLQLDEVFAGFEQMVTMAKELGSALEKTGGIAKSIARESAVVERLEKELDAARGRRNELEQERLNYSVILQSEPHKRARTLIATLRDTQLH